MLLLIGLGMEDGQKIVFNGEGDQEPNIEPGDIVIVLDEQEHDTFKRVGTDLSMRIELSLVEALCGFKRPIKTLDDRTIVISSIPGEINNVLPAIALFIYIMINIPVGRNVLPANALLLINAKISL